MQKTKSYLGTIFGLLIFSSIPGLLALKYPEFFSFFKIYFIIMILWGLIVMFFLKKTPAPFSLKRLRSINIIYVFIPLVITISYPLSYLSLSLSLITILFGIFLPFFNRRLSLWFYTLGNRFPLSEDMAWMKDEYQKEEGKRYVNFLNNFSKSNLVSYSLGLGYLAVALLSLFLDADSADLTVIRAVCLLLLFAFSLTIGAGLKNNSYSIKKSTSGVESLIPRL